MKHIKPITYLLLAICLLLASAPFALRGLVAGLGQAHAADTQPSGFRFIFGRIESVATTQFTGGFAKETPMVVQARLPILGDALAPRPIAPINDTRPRSISVMGVGPKYDISHYQ